MDLLQIISKHYRTLQVPVAVSHRHAHLSPEAAQVVFGEGYELHKRNDLTQPGQYACHETIEVVTHKAAITCRVVGPYREHTQVELSRSDAIMLGINPPVRLSADIRGSASATLVGPSGKYALSEGIIIPQRHAHISRQEAQECGLTHGNEVSVALRTGRGYHILGSVACRVGDGHRLEVHLNRDEGNALGIEHTSIGYLLWP